MQIRTRHTTFSRKTGSGLWSKGTADVAVPCQVDK